MEIRISTRQTRDIVDLTEQVASAVASLADSIVRVSAPHTTVALFVSELDDGLRDDFLKIAAHLFQHARPFSHVKNNNPNTEAYALSAMFGTSITLGVIDGKVRHGTYPRIIFFKLDGPAPRSRRVAASME